MQSKWLIIAALTVLAAPPAHSRTIHVNPEATADYPTIQAAVDAAQDGDTILLADGTCTGEGNRDIVGRTSEILSRGVSAMLMSKHLTSTP